MAVLDLIVTMVILVTTMTITTNMITTTDDHFYTDRRYRLQILLNHTGVL